MRRKILKVIILIIYAMLILSILSNVYAAGAISGSFTGTLGEAENSVDPIIKILSAVLFIIRMGGMVIATVILMVIACKYMIASAGDRADIKKYAVSYIIGAVVLFGTAGIAGLLQEVITSAFGAAGASGGTGGSTGAGAGGGPTPAVK